MNKASNMSPLRSHLPSAVNTDLVAQGEQAQSKPFRDARAPHANLLQHVAMTRSRVATFRVARHSLEPERADFFFFAPEMTPKVARHCRVGAGVSHVF